MPATFTRFLLLIVISLLVNSCGSYYARNREFQKLVSERRFSEAESLLAKSKKAKKKRNRVLYLLNRGYVTYAQGKHQESSKYFMEADLLMEDYSKNIGYEALALLVNPSVKPYRAEDFEQVLLHYYNALNFLKLRNFESALVECRRLNLKLLSTVAKYKEKPKYKEDAFGHLLMGLAYEASGDINNAFIAYRNALDVYERDYKPFFGMDAPAQLKRDVLRLAGALDFRNDVELYTKQFGWENTIIEKGRPEAELVVFWNNGMGPVKEEWSIDFSIITSGDNIVFTNPGLGYNFAFPASSVSSNDAKNLNELSVFRIAFPRYVRRPVFYSSAEAFADGRTYQFEESEDIDAIAFKSLNDRFAREMGTALLRFALKKATEYAVKKQNKDAASVLSLANAITEHADTRNWQTLPNKISYSRIPLKAGENKIIFRAFGAAGINGAVFTDTISVSALKGKMYFETINTPQGANAIR